MRKVFLLFCLILLTGSVINAQTVNVTFQVDMSVQALKGAFDPASDTVYVRGSFNSWGQTAMSDANADSIYDVTISLDTNSNQAYKFFHQGGGGTWEDNISDRPLAVGISDTTLDPVWFDNEAIPSGAPANVTFEVDMSLPIQQVADFATTKKVKVAGSFTNWQTNPIEMLDGDGDSVYTVTTPVNSAQLIAFKFIYTNLDDTTGITWESIPDRTHWVVDGDQSISEFWNDEDPNVQLADGNILFVCDMSVATELGVFNPNVDSVQIRAEFNGWNESDPARSKMNQSSGNPDVWFLNVPFVQLPVNDTMIYKYFIKNGTGSTPYSNTGWEVAISPTTAVNRDRPVVFLGQSNQEQGTQYFEGIHPDWVIPSGTTVEATFSVDMTAATGFDPATDSVVWIPRQPFYFAVHNIPWPGDQPRVLYLTDSNTDMVYEGTLTINGPDFNGFLYNYAYVDVSATNTLVLEGGSQGECRVRYVAQTGPRAFVSPYSFPQDVWTASGQKPEEDGPTVGVTDKGLAALTYKLSQNYPNPFNPST
ncbi:MAG: hypothetical protein ACM34O_02815, partial [Ignavibacteria bacterium]